MTECDPWAPQGRKELTPTRCSHFQVRTSACTLPLIKSVNLKRKNNGAGEPEVCTEHTQASFPVIIYYMIRYTTLYVVFDIKSNVGMI